MKKYLATLVIILLLQAPLLFLISFNSDSSTITTFSDSSPEKTISFPSGGGIDGSSAFEIPKKATIIDAAFNVSNVYNINGYHPNSPKIDVGNDGDYEWAFIGSGYGDFGEQNVFTSNLPAEPVFFDTNNTYDNQIRLLMPKNATVGSAVMKVRGSGAGDVLLVTDGGNSYGLNIIKSALIGMGNTVKLCTESGLPGSWNDPNVYDSIFWIGGTSSANGPSNTLIKSFVNYVKGGGNVFMCGAWIDYTGSYSGVDEIPFFEWALHNTWGNRWGGGGSGIGTANKYTHQSNTSHPVFNTPNSLPSYWNNLYTGTFWHTPSATINNGSVIGKVDTTTTNPKYSAIIAWDGQFYNPAYGRTLMVRQPVSHSWYNITQGNVLSNFTENLATWFMGSGEVANVTIDVGDNGGLPEFDHSGVLDDLVNMSDFRTEINSLIGLAPVVFTDDYGIQFVEIPLNVTADGNGTVLLIDMDIRYNLTTLAFKNPHNGDLIIELNELVPDTGEGNITIPIVIISSSEGKVKLSDIMLEYSLPELTNDKLLLLNGHDPNNICYPDYENYTFIVNVTNIAGVTDLANITLTLDVDGERLQVQWNQNELEFLELYDPRNMIELNIANCQSTIITPERCSVEFEIRFTWNYINETMELCMVNTTNDTGAWVSNYFEDVYRIENGLDLIGTMDVHSQFQGELIEDGIQNWVRANEIITWGNLTVVYEGTTNIFPDNKNFNITITDDDTGSWVNDSSSGTVFNIQTVSDPISDYSDIHSIDITNIPGVGHDVSNWNFMIKTDNDGPLTPPNLRCHADSPFDPETGADDDITVFVTWTPASDVSGSGVKEYALEFNNPNPTAIGTSGDAIDGVEGDCRFYVRARDNVGNWGVTGIASIAIDLTELSFTQHTPNYNSWQNTSTVECGILIQDIGGSGVDTDSIQYRYVESGSIDNAGWNKYVTSTPSGETIPCKQNITFTNDGSDKKVQWRAKDRAGIGYVYSNVFKLKVDSNVVTFEGFSWDFDKWYPTLTPEIKFYINDTNPNGESSGVDTSTILYSYSTSGLAGYGPWQVFSNKPLSGNNGWYEGSGESVKCIMNLELKEGEANFIRFKVSDLAGNLKISPDHNIKLDISEPTFSDPEPGSFKWNNSTLVKCQITVNDEYSKVDMNEVKYSISTAGMEQYSKWIRVPASLYEESTYYSIRITCNERFIEGENNYVRWLVADTAGNAKISDEYRINVDLTDCTYHTPYPRSDMWMNSETVNCEIMIDDLTGSGIDISTIGYTVSTTGPEQKNKTEWSNKYLEITTHETTHLNGEDGLRPVSVEVDTTVTGLLDGANNYIFWHARDLAGNNASIGGPYVIKVDRSSLDFYGPKPVRGSMHFDVEQLCEITIKDSGGSGVDPTSVEYSFSSTGLDDLSAWNRSGISYSNYGYGYKFLVYLNFKEGSENYIEWRGKDLAGNGYYVSERYDFIINSPPEIIISKPNPNKNYPPDGNVIFNARNSYDPDPEDILTFFWVSDRLGPIGSTDYFKYSLLPGLHKITLYLSDNNNHNVSLSVDITVDHEDMDNDGTPDIFDEDIDGDHRPNGRDAFPRDKDEWLDTDFDGVGDNADTDDDNDGYRDNEDDYPLDNKRWESPTTEQTINSWYYYIPIIVVVTISLLILTIMIKKRRTRAKLTAEEAEKQALAAASSEGSGTDADQDDAVETARGSYQAKNTFIIQPGCPYLLKPGDYYQDGVIYHNVHMAVARPIYRPPVFYLAQPTVPMLPPARFPVQPMYQPPPLPYQRPYQVSQPLGVGMYSQPQRYYYRR